MHAADIVEQILLESLTDYMKNNKLVISKIEQTSLENHSSHDNCLTITLDDGKMVNIIIYEAE